jgi:uncharacterized membrane protein
MHLTPRLVFFLVLPPLLWAGNAVVGRLAIGSMDPLWLNAVRWMLAFVLLLPLGWRALGTPAARAQIRARWTHLAVLGLIGVGAYNALQYMALRTSTPLNVTLIASSAPVWMMLIGAVFYRVIPRPVQVFGALLSLVGVALVLSRGDPAAIARIEFVEGDLLMLLAMLGWTGYSWMLARPPAHMAGEARPEVELGRVPGRPVRLRGAVGGGRRRGGRRRVPVRAHAVVVGPGRGHRLYRRRPLDHRLPLLGRGGGRGRPGHRGHLLQPHPALRRGVLRRGDRRMAAPLPRHRLPADRGRHPGEHPRAARRQAA